MRRRGRCPAGDQQRRAAAPARTAAVPRRPSTPSMQWNRFLLGPPGHARRPARDRPSHLRPRDHAHGDLRRRRRDPPRGAPVPRPRARRARAPRRSPPSTRPRTTRSSRCIPPCARRSSSSTGDARPGADGARPEPGHRGSAGASRRRSSRAARERRLERGAHPVPARTGARRLPAHAARVRAARVHPLAAVRPFVLHRADAAPAAGPARADEPAVRRRTQGGAGARRRRPARPARPSRRRSACSGTRRSGRPGTGSPRRSALAHHGDLFGRRAHVRGAEPRRSRTPRSRSTTRSTPTASGAR